MKTFIELAGLVTKCDHPVFRFMVRRHPGTQRPYLQIRCLGTCNTTGEPLDWAGRKWGLSYHMTDSEVVQTCFKAVLTALEHEAREQFRFDGAAVMNPHYDIYALKRLCEEQAFDEREDHRAA